MHVEDRSVCLFIIYCAAVDPNVGECRVATRAFAVCTAARYMFNYAARAQLSPPATQSFIALKIQILAQIGAHVWSVMTSRVRTANEKRHKKSSLARWQKVRLNSRCTCVARGGGGGGGGGWGGGSGAGATSNFF
jgi:hypothetical protein